MKDRYLFKAKIKENNNTGYKEMAIKPILFNKQISTEMVRAILEGRKTCTRRLVKLPSNIKQQEDGLYTLWAEGTCYENQHLEEIIGYIRAPYQPADIMYVCETWRVGAWDIQNQMIAFDYKDSTCGELTYIHDQELFEMLVNQSREDARKAKCDYNGVDFVWEKGKSPCRWHPSIHMPKEAARIWLKVTDVRVERLQEMWASDVSKEGLLFNKPTTADEMLLAFAELWNSIIKKSDLDRYGWNANPYVWIIEFERCEKPDF